MSPGFVAAIGFDGFAVEYCLLLNLHDDEIWSAGNSKLDFLMVLRKILVVITLERLERMDILIVEIKAGNVI